MRRSISLALLGIISGAALCATAVTHAAQGTASIPPDPDARLAALGRLVFHDRSLSLNRNQACASCHDVAWGFTSPDTAVNAGGGVMPGSIPSRFGTRKPPSAAYAAASPVLHFDTKDSVWVGGSFWDGRASGQHMGNPAAEQAQGPFVNPVEQALPDVACVVFRVTRGEYGALARAVLGADADEIRFPRSTDRSCGTEGTTVPLDSADRRRVHDAYETIARSLVAFERSPEVSPFSSKYDAYLRGEAVLTDEEREGLSIYENEGKCSACHPNAGDRALFTDFTFDNIGVPANPRNPAREHESDYRDEGLGGVLRDDALRGAQKVPTLRNVNRRGIAGAPKAYMHNGYFKSLEAVVHFYNTRDALPACESLAAPRAGFNCWPRAEIAENVNRDELGDLDLTPRQERALVAYLRTLDDGYRTQKQ